MKVYITTKGNYSDYRITAVFSNRELAEKYPHKDEIEEYEVDEPFEVFHNITITMKENGDIVNINHNIDTENNEGFKHYYNNYIIWIVNTNDTKRAIKIVNEKRIQILANDLWSKNLETRKYFS